MSIGKEGCNRRDFLKLSSLAWGMTLLGCEEVDPNTADASSSGMRYRSLGNTGQKVSEVAFGAHGVDNPPLMSAALDVGINTFCTSGQYLDGLEEVALGRALHAAGAVRDEVVIVTGNRTRPGTSKKRVLTDIDDSLRRLNTDYLDFYYTAEVRTPDDIQVEGLFEAIAEAKAAGKVRHLGLSGHHGGMQDCLNAAIADGRFELFFIKYDFVSYPDQDELLRRAAAKGIGSIVFKTNAGNRQREIKDLEAGGLSFKQATIKWALTNPNVNSVAVTFTNFDLIQECSSAVNARITRNEVGMLRRYRDTMFDRYCRFCGVCEGHCPEEVAVPEIMRYAMYFKYYGREREAMHHYHALTQSKSATNCQDCSGHCDGGCPFGRKVREGLLEAHDMLHFTNA